MSWSIENPGFSIKLSSILCATEALIYDRSEEEAFAILSSKVGVVGEDAMKEGETEKLRTEVLRMNELEKRIIQDATLRPIPVLIME